MASVFYPEDNVVTKSRVFKNAYKMYHSVDVELTSSSENALYFSAVDPDSKKEHMVVIKYNEEGRVLELSCTCTIQSMKIKHRPICSHMVAVLTKAMFELGRKYKKPKEEEE